MENLNSLSQNQVQPLELFWDLKRRVAPTKQDPNPGRYYVDQNNVAFSNINPNGIVDPYSIDQNYVDVNSVWSRNFDKLSIPEYQRRLQQSLDIGGIVDMSGRVLAPGTKVWGPGGYATFTPNARQIVNQGVGGDTYGETERDWRRGDMLENWTWTDADYKMADGRVIPAGFLTGKAGGRDIIEQTLGNVGIIPIDYDPGSGWGDAIGAWMSSFGPIVGGTFAGAASSAAEGMSTAENLAVTLAEAGMDISTAEALANALVKFGPGVAQGAIKGGLSGGPTGALTGAAGGAVGGYTGNAPLGGLTTMGLNYLANSFGGGSNPANPQIPTIPQPGQTANTAQMPQQPNLNFMAKTPRREEPVQNSLFTSPYLNTKWEYQKNG